MSISVNMTGKTKTHKHHLKCNIHSVKQTFTCRRACSSFSVCVHRDSSRIVLSSLSFSLSEVSSHTERCRSSSSCRVASSSSTVLSCASYNSATSYNHSMYSHHSEKYFKSVNFDKEQHCRRSTPKLPFPSGIRAPSPYPKRHHDRFGYFSTAHGQVQLVDRHTDHRTSVTTGCIFALCAHDAA